MFANVFAGLSLAILELNALAPSAAVLVSPVENSVIERVKATLPSGWSIVETRLGVLPEGHFWGESYKGDKGCGLQLQGPENVTVRWQDAQKVWHDEPVGKESLWLYIMPPTYAESEKRHLQPKRPVPAQLIVENSRYKLYAYPTSRIVQPNRMEFILKENISIEWPNSPRTTQLLSWGNWKGEIQSSLSVPVK